jgi:hypothetical protein
MSFFHGCNAIGVDTDAPAGGPECERDRAMTYSACRCVGTKRARETAMSEVDGGSLGSALITHSYLAYLCQSPTGRQTLWPSRAF